jgi:phenylpropionate dioxygenase-like ring-hydroxylating dioxygenase large terminal subunit
MSQSTLDEVQSSGTTAPTGAAAPTELTAVAAPPTPAPWIDNTTQELAPAWYPVARSHELGDEPLAVQLLETWWVLARLDGELSAFVDECPHRLLPLSAGKICGSTIQCAYHGWTFAADGSCTTVPSSGPDATIPGRARLRAPAGVQERYGLIWLAPETPVCDLPDLPDFEDPSFEVRHDDPARTTAGFGQCMDNFVDTSHFLMVHAGTFGGDAAAEAQPETISRDGWVVTADYETPYNVLDDPRVASGEIPAEQISPQRKTFYPGSIMVLRMEFPVTDSIFSIVITAQPEADGSTRIYRMWARNDIVGDEARWDEHVRVEQAIMAEDLETFAIYRDRRLPLELRREVHVAADKLSVAYRRVMADLVVHGAALHADS